MSLEAIKTISEAEEQAKNIRAVAAAEAKRVLGEAEAAGKAAVEAAEKKGRDELAELAKKLGELGNHAASEQVLAAVSEFEKGNLRLSAVLASLK